MFLNCNYYGSPRFDLIPDYMLNRCSKVNGKIIINTDLGSESSLLEDCEHRSFHL